MIKRMTRFTTIIANVNQITCIYIHIIHISINNNNMFKQLSYYINLF